MNHLSDKLLNFACPDCESGSMFQVKLGPISNIFKCNFCETELFMPQKTIIRYLMKPEEKILPIPRRIEIPLKDSTVSTPSNS
jgi:hypothetical protein